MIAAQRTNLEAACRHYSDTRNRLILKRGVIIDDVLQQLAVDQTQRCDAFQDGVLGLMRSFEKFDATKHHSFERFVRQQVEAAQAEPPPVAA